MHDKALPDEYMEEIVYKESIELKLAWQFLREICATTG
jgi:hypothetical protein